MRQLQTRNLSGTGRLSRQPGPNKRPVRNALSYQRGCLSALMAVVSKPLSKTSSIAVQWEADVSFTVPIIHADPCAMDTIDDRVDELRKHGKSAEALINELLAERIAEERTEVLTGLLCYVLKSKRPVKAMWQCAFAAGISIATQTTMVEVCKQFGITKQAFQQGVESIREDLELKKTRTMRTDEAREHMRQRNSRRGLLR